MAGDILMALFPIGFIFSIVIGYFAYRENWRIAKWF
jgi:hypothetical protein